MSPKHGVTYIGDEQMAEEQSNNKELQRWRKTLNTYLDLEEFKTICFDLEGIDYDNIAGDTLNTKAISLLKQLERTNTLSKLQDYIFEEAPFAHVKDGYWAEALDLTRRSLNGADTAASPYLGLEAFQEKDAPLYFGRAPLISQLIQKLQFTLSHPQQPNFLAIIGASGSGKSSLVRAGMIPQLRPHNWPIFIMTPTADPLASLARTLMAGVESKTAALTMQDDLQKESRSLHAYLPDIAQRQESEPPHLILIIDQFEELFTLCHHEETRTQFVDNLLYALDPAQQSKLTILLTLRADFYHRVAWSDGLRNLLKSQQEYIGRMSRADLQQTIEGPARLYGYTLQEGLVKRILDEVGNEPGNLPLLSHALHETWQQREGSDGKALTLAGYEKAGGVKGAITRTAETEFAKLNSAEQAIARSAFIRLTELGEGSEDTRCRVPISDLISNNRDSEMVLTVLAHLAGARLVTTDGKNVDISHEVLIREWRTLRQWLDDDRNNLRVHSQLTKAASFWKANGHLQKDLYQGTRLTQAQESVEASLLELSSIETLFLTSSQQFREKQKQEKEEQYQRSIKQGRKTLIETLRRQESDKKRLLASEKRHQAEKKAREQASLRVVEVENFNLQLRKGRDTAFSLVGIVVLIFLASIYFYFQARGNNLFAQAQASVSLSTAIVPKLPTTSDLELARLLGIQGTKLSENLKGSWFSQKIDPTFIYTQMRHLYNLPKNAPLQGHTSRVLSVVYSPDGQTLASASSDFTINLWNINDLQMAPIALNGHESIVNSLSYSSDGSLLASASADQTIRLWQITDLQKDSIVLQGHTDEVTSTTFSPDGRLLASSSKDETIRLWSLDNLDLKPIILGAHADGVATVVFSPDNQLLASASNDGMILVWTMNDLQSGPATLHGHSWRVTSIAFSADSKTLASGSWDQTVRLWDLQDVSKDPEILWDHSNAVTSVAFSPDGKL